MTKGELKKPNRDWWKFTCTGIKIIAAIFALFFCLAFVAAILTGNWRLVPSALLDSALAAGVYLFCEHINNLKKRIDKLEKQLQEEKDE